MSDALDARRGLPEAHRWLLETWPRLRWRDPDLGEVARFWLQMHGSFRHKQVEMAREVADWRAGGDLVLLHRDLIPTLQAYLQHLDGHHRVETGHYFPVMRRVEPRITAGGNRPSEQTRIAVPILFTGCGKISRRRGSGVPR
ncbi:MAG: hypothetical protein ACOVQ6_22075 [Brevundimonas sp.]